MTFLCSQDRIFVLDEDRGMADFRAPLGNALSYDDVPGWIKRFNSRKIELGDVIVTGAGKADYTNIGFQRRATLDLAIVFTPKPGEGDTLDALSSAESAFRRFLAQADPRTHFAYFIVRPDCLAAFAAARAIAASMDFETGWNPSATKDVSVRFTLTGDGVAPVPQ